MDHYLNISFVFELFLNYYEKYLQRYLKFCDLFK